MDMASDEGPFCMEGGGLLQEMGDEGVGGDEAVGVLYKGCGRNKIEAAKEDIVFQAVTLGRPG